MNKVNQSSRTQAGRKRKMMLVLPVLVIPFLTLAFYAMGGGSGRKEKTVSINGLNLKLPEAHVKDDKALDKLSFYDKADKDSAKLAEWMRSDPYYKEKTESIEPGAKDLEQLTQTTATKYNQRLNVSLYEKSKANPEDQVIQKLTLLQKELNKNSTTSYKEPDTYVPDNTNPGFSKEVNRLENMMNMMNSGNSEDPEMKQVSSVMDKILDIQHPERVKEKIKEKSLLQTANAMKVSNKAADDTAVNGFYGIENETELKPNNAIEAVVNENQVLVNGGIIKLRLLQDMFINNQTIPAGNFIYGTVGLNGERLEVEINSIRSGSNLYNVKMELHDMDGLAGIYIPGAITRDVAKQSADNSLQMMELTTLDPSLKAQATSAGINTIKSLLTKKVKLIKVMVKAGYKVFLLDKSTQQ